MPDHYILTPRERFTHFLGACYRTELDVANGERDWWQIEDLDGREVCVIVRDGRYWQASAPVGRLLVKHHPTFTAALEDRVAAIQASGGVQTDELFWRGDGLPRWV